MSDSSAAQCAGADMLTCWATSGASRSGEGPLRGGARGRSSQGRKSDNHLSQRRMCLIELPIIDLSNRLGGLFRRKAELMAPLAMPQGAATQVEGARANVPFGAHLGCKGRLLERPTSLRTHTHGQQFSTSSYLRRAGACRDEREFSDHEELARIPRGGEGLACGSVAPPPLVSRSRQALSE